MNPPSGPTSIQEFFDLWSIYDLVLEHDCMFHRELYDVVRRTLANYFGSRAFSVLDLGCGSGRHLAPVLQLLPVNRYEGHDLSPVAIAHARQNFAPLGARAQFCTGDLRAALQGGSATFDLIFSGFTLHHFTAAERGEILRALQPRLAPGGLVLIVDSMRAEDEDRDRWLDRYCGWIESEWREIPAAGRAVVIGHIREYDHPGTVADYNAHAGAAHFQRSGEVYRCGWHSVWSCA